MTTSGQKHLVQGSEKIKSGLKEKNCNELLFAGLQHAML